MRVILKLTVLLLAIAAAMPAQQNDSEEKDTSAHVVHLLEVQNGVNVEVLDWGGSGRPLIFIPANGFTGHEFDSFAPEFIGTHHVYGITRRGFGSSSAPAPDQHNYSADRLGDDILAVIEELHIDRPVLVGHSLGGEELSSIASRHPEKVSGLVYLDAAYSYAYYDANVGDLVLDSIDLHNKLSAFLSVQNPEVDAVLSAIEADLPRYEKDVRNQRELFALLPPHPPAQGQPDPIQVAISNGRQKYTKITVPALAIFADPHGEFAHAYPDDPKKREALAANDKATTTAQADAFERGVPSAKVVLLPNASHMIFQSNEADVLREMNAFLATLH
ncbi:MAG: alpha/beta fold hydrolase [Acidobacteriaceae bacterium]